MTKPTLSEFKLVVTKNRIISFQRTDYPILKQGKTIPFEVLIKGSTTYIQKSEIDRLDVNNGVLDGPRDSQEPCYHAKLVAQYQDNKRAMQVLLSGIITHVVAEAERIVANYKKSIEALREVALEEMSREQSKDG